jgi:uncharacterized protein (DUF736 family)
VAVIGRFTPAKDGYVGRIRTLTISARVRIIACDRKTSNAAPDFRVYAGGMDVGAAWIDDAGRHGERRLSVKLDDPGWGGPRRAELIERDGAAELQWKRQSIEGTNSPEPRHDAGARRAVPGRGDRALHQGVAPVEPRDE